jgi:methionine-rich copper-binding protein CopC
MTFGRVLLGTLVAALLAVWPSVPAGAHSSVVASWPAAGQLVNVAPDRLTIEFTTEVLPDLLLAVVAPDGSSLVDGDPVVQGHFVTQALTESEANGAYYASFQVVGADRHPIIGRVDFVVAAGGVATQNPAGDPPDLALDDDDVVETSEADTADSSGSGPLLLLAGLGGVGVLIVAIRLAERRARATSDEG